jgi:hypothetical protein
VGAYIRQHSLGYINAFFEFAKSCVGFRELVESCLGIR